MSDIDDTSSVAALPEAVTETASQPSTLNQRSQQDKPNQDKPSQAKSTGLTCLDTGLPTPIQKKPKSSHLGAHSYLAQRPSPANRDEVKQYLEEPIYEDEEAEDPFEWWRQREKDFPRLARMAYDLLSMPSTACECERVFSLAKLLVGTQRHSLQDLMMEMLTCVKLWRRNPLILSRALVLDDCFIHRYQSAIELTMAGLLTNTA
ncbi:hypothetical protein ACKAV7_008424 [Fusarium commune]